VKNKVPDGRIKVSDVNNEDLGGKQGIRFLFGSKEDIADKAEF
jgi:hypothetical protein